MENTNANSQLGEPTRQSEDSVSGVLVHNLSQRLEVLEHSVHYLVDNMMTRLSVMEGRVVALIRRMDGYNDLNRSWSQQVSLEFPAVSPDAPVLPSPPVPSRHKMKQGTLTSRRVIRRYQRLVKPSWDNKSFIKHVIKKIKKKRRQRS
ncbi:hypothetical protein BHE74_00007626 [Ensete ventricosum]|nr:hypothetical protein B296_00023317 [Ensete ventricosum]RWW13756.1 hypothetical protein GW17_00022515 [Ensete ventricosum]RWW83843.1 hypothetical protein BHE74_00007626 [Ensete ventricosum]RZR79703.1 hypothetical protein BHM03_00005509 [Ensete ventricosum]